jgi:hypothetical protein
MGCAGDASAPAPLGRALARDRYLAPAFTGDCRKSTWVNFGRVRSLRHISLRGVGRQAADARKPIGCWRCTHDRSAMFHPRHQRAFVLVEIRN